MQPLVHLFDRLNDYTGRLAAATVVVLVLLVTYDTLARYLFSGGSIALQELEWHLHDVLFMLGISFALRHKAHVRVDLFYEKYSPRLKAWINLIGIIMLVIPFSAFILYTGATFAADAYGYMEGSPNPGGLPYRYLVKSLMALAFGLVIIQSVAEIITSIQCLKGERPCD